MEPKIPIYCNHLQIFTFLPIAIFCQVVETKQVGNMMRNLYSAAWKIFLLPISWAGVWDLIRCERKICCYDSELYRKRLPAILMFMTPNLCWGNFFYVVLLPQLAYQHTITL